MTLLTFATWIPVAHSPALLDFFYASIYSTMVYPALGNFDVVVSVSIDFLSNSKQDAPFHCITSNYSHADWDDLCDYLRDGPKEDIFKLIAPAATNEFYDWIQLGIDVYINNLKYQFKRYSSPWFSTACAAAIVNKNHSFHLCQQNKSSKSNIKSREASNPCRRALKATKIAYANKTRVHYFPEFWLAGLVVNCKYCF